MYRVRPTHNMLMNSLDYHKRWSNVSLYEAVTFMKLLDLTFRCYLLMKDLFSLSFWSLKTFNWYLNSIANTSRNTKYCKLPNITLGMLEGSIDDPVNTNLRQES